MESGIVIGLAFTAAIVYIVVAYNRLVKLKNRYANSFAQIDVQLKRRADLIPNLIETAKGYLKHERETLQNVVEARNTALQAQKRAAEAPGDPSAMKGLAHAEGLLQRAMSGLNVVVEQYPDLKASENMMQLTEELSTTENKIAFARQAYNDAVMAFNTFRQSFPAILFAGFFGFSDDAGLLEFEDREEIREAPKVSF